MGHSRTLARASQRAHLFVGCVAQGSYSVAVTLPFAASVRIAAAALACRSVDDANRLFSPGAG
jgi:hypothetical protein